MLLIGGIIISAGIVLAYIALSSVDSTYGYADSQVAEGMANAGAEDAVMQFVRNADFSPAGGNYVVTLSNGQASVTVSNPGTGTATITSVASYESHTRTINVVLAINLLTNQVSVTRWADI